jgi:hypothetical protein
MITYDRARARTSATTSCSLMTWPAATYPKVYEMGQFDWNTRPGSRPTSTFRNPRTSRAAKATAARGRS